MKPVKSDPRLEAALRLMRETGTQSKAAKEAGVSVERFRRFLFDNDLAKREGRKWQFTDNRQREMLVLSQGHARTMRLDGFDQASLNGAYLTSVKNFINRNDADYLADFIGLSVRDAKGKSHPFETDPNTLYRLAASGDEIFEAVYKLVTL